MIVALSFNAEQVAQAESLLDFIFFLHGKKKADAILLISAPNVHQEYTTKIKISAEVAFNHVHLIYGKSDDLFAAASECIESIYRDIWLYLEPDSVPLIPRWIEAIENAYLDQPKKILGPHLKKDERTWVAVNSVYSQDIHRMSGQELTICSTKTRVIQIGKYTGRADVRDKSKDDPAYLFCGDSSGELIKTLRAESKLK